MIIVIDLGTTNSLVAYYDETGAKIIPNHLGRNLTPSVVSVDSNGNIYVGETAKVRKVRYPEETMDVFKRGMGSDEKYQLGRHSFYAEDLSSFILRFLKKAAQDYLGQEITEAVISVPAYFDDKRRKATKRAGELAGLKVERIISEPTAAAIAYGLADRYSKSKFMVFDLGGGTFDVSVLELCDSILEVHAVAGDNYLGGEDFTRVLIDKFIQRNKINPEILTLKEHALIRREAERCKIALSKNASRTMVCKIRGKEFRLDITLPDYEKMCSALLDRIKYPLQKSLIDAKIRRNDIDEIVLVGGATRLPIIREYIVKLFNKQPNTSVNPDEAVALGTALQAAMKERKGSMTEVILTDVCSFTLGTEIAVEKEDGQYEEGHFCPIIERNTVIPASKTERFYTTHDNQESLHINILQGESQYASGNLLLGTLSVNVPVNKAGIESIDVTYTYDINSILEVQVRVTSTGETTKKVIRNLENELSKDEIAARTRELFRYTLLPKEQEQDMLILFKAENLCEESSGDARKFLDYGSRKYKAALDSRDPQAILECKKEILKIMKVVKERF